MQQWTRARLVLLFALVAGVAASARAQGRGSVAVFTAGLEHAPGATLGARIAHQLDLEGFQVVPLGLAGATAPVDTEKLLNDARSLGSQALQELGQGKSADMLARYGARIDTMLQNAGSVRAREARALLWNLCVLKVQLLWMGGGASPAAEAAIDTCRRSFVDQSQFSAAWLPEVVEAFKQHAESHPRVQFSIQSAPAACEVYLYGARVGTTPMHLDVLPGPQHVQLSCSGRESLPRTVVARDGRTLVVRLAGDAALTSGLGDVAALEYASEVALGEAPDHAQALAREAEAASFVLATLHHDRATLELYDSAGQRIRRLLTPLDAAPETHYAATAELVNGTRSAGLSTADAQPVRSFERHLADYLLGGGLVALGLATSVTPWLAVARDGECYNADCSLLYDGNGPRVYVGVAGSTLALASGIAILWRAPFGRRWNVKVEPAVAGLRVRGTF